MIDNGLGEKVPAVEVYYKKNKKLPAEGTRYHYTEKMKEAWKRAKEDVVYFAQNFFTIIDLSDGGKRKHIPLREYQLDFLREMQHNNRVVFNTSRQIGKCVTGDTKIQVRLKVLPFIHFNVSIETVYRVAKWRERLFKTA